MYLNVIYKINQSQMTLDQTAAFTRSFRSIFILRGGGGWAINESNRAPFSQKKNIHLMYEHTYRNNRINTSKKNLALEWLPDNVSIVSIILFLVFFFPIFRNPTIATAHYTHTHSHTLTRYLVENVVKPTTTSTYTPFDGILWTHGRIPYRKPFSVQMRCKNNKNKFKGTNV